MKLEIGQQAPDFLMYDTDKNPFRLSEHKGTPFLLLFFPFAFTSTCTKELCNTRDDISFYNNINAKVLGISVDAPYSLKEYRNQQNLNFPLLSDFNKTVSETYGCLQDRWGMELKGVSKRSAFIIDGEGIIRYIEILEDAGKIPDFDAIKKVLTDIVGVNRESGKCCLIRSASFRDDNLITHNSLLIFVNRQSSFVNPQSTP
ncbi:MAG: redoxin domain-containing protein [Bacteroidetes bacterium]|nr:redoxin domain-containing protein [Bacteroidota bacterium]